MLDLKDITKHLLNYVGLFLNKHKKDKIYIAYLKISDFNICKSRNAVNIFLFLFSKHVPNPKSIQISSVIIQMKDLSHVGFNIFNLKTNSFHFPLKLPAFIRV